MKLIEMIAEEVIEADCSNDRGFGSSVLDPDAVAASITARLHECVKPLEWDGFCSGHYKIEVEKGGIANLYFYGNAADQEEDGPELIEGGYLTLVGLDDLKAAAQAHYAKASVEAFL